MIGPPPTYYDPDQETQSQTQDYSHWIAPYSQVFSNPSLYPSQVSTADSGTGRPIQPLQHTNRYQFVNNSQPSSDPTTCDFFPLVRFDGHSGPSRPQHNPAHTAHTQNWQTIGLSQRPTQDLLTVPRPVVHPFSDTHGLGPVQFPFPSHAENVPGSVLTPPSEEATLTSASRSPAVADNQPLPAGSSNTSTTITFNTSSKQEKYPQTKHRTPRKRPKAETDSDDDEDPADVNVGANLPRPNRL
jgi:hypothetical protein